MMKMTMTEKRDRVDKVKDFLELAGMVMFTAGIGSTIVVIFFILLNGRG